MIACSKEGALSVNAEAGVSIKVPLAKALTKAPKNLPDRITQNPQFIFAQ
jgi:hypothetical protein